MVRDVGGVSLLLDQKQPVSCKGQHKALLTGDLWGWWGGYSLVEPSFPDNETLGLPLTCQRTEGLSEDKRH